MAQTKRKPPTMEPPKFEDYWKLRMEGATMRLRAAQKIISHTGTRGSLAENLLRELIRDFLPQRWAVATGFIMDSATDGTASIRSNQIDAIIYDQHDNSPVFKDGELVVLAPGAEKVAIEVKSSLTTDQISNAYGNICSVKAVDPRVKGFIFGYDGAQATTFADRVTKWSQQTGAPPRELWPDRVFNMGQGFLVLPDPTPVGAGGTLQFSIAAEKDPVVQLFLTVVLAEAGVDKVRAFFMTENTGEELLKF